MQSWQEEYIQNARELVRLRDYAGPAREGRLAEARSQADQMLRRNNELLNLHFFPALDQLPTAAPEEIAELNAFAAALLDWRENLDIGVYIALHDALLRLSRIRRDRRGIIRELYLLGMGLYYQRRMILGAEKGVGASFHFENELVFTEAASYFRYFADLEDEETQGYVIRAIANIAICVQEPRRKIAASMRVLQIIRDPQIRALAPGLPWDRFLRGTHQQMSSNRASLSRGDLSQEELSAVLDSCYEVFRPEEASANPSVRWLWPYYEMEYNCGYIPLDQTLRRLKKLILQTPWNQYDVSGLYGNVQLPTIYARLMKRVPSLQQDPREIAFLHQACQKMRKTLMTFPLDAFDDYLLYNLMLPLGDYTELPGLQPYREFILPLIMRFFGDDYLQGRTCGEMIALICEALMRSDPRFFDDLPLPDASGAPDQADVLAFARDAGLFHDIGRIVMNTIRRPRNLFDFETRLTALHPVMGRDILAGRASTQSLADIALGHHAWYNGSAQGYPVEYVRTDSPFRQMTDVAAVVSFLMDQYRGEMKPLLDKVYAEEGIRFSPLVTAVLADETLQTPLERLLKGEARPAFDQEIQAELSRWDISPDP